MSLDAAELGREAEEGGTRRARKWARQNWRAAAKPCVSWTTPTRARATEASASSYRTASLVGEVALAGKRFSVSFRLQCTRERNGTPHLSVPPDQSRTSRSLLGADLVPDDPGSTSPLHQMAIRAFLPRHFRVVVLPSDEGPLTPTGSNTPRELGDLGERLRTDVQRQGGFGGAGGQVGERFEDEFGRERAEEGVAQGGEGTVVRVRRSVRGGGGRDTGRGRGRERPVMEVGELPVRLGGEGDLILQVAHSVPKALMNQRLLDPRQLLLRVVGREEVQVGERDARCESCEGGFGRGVGVGVEERELLLRQGDGRRLKGAGLVRQDGGVGGSCRFRGGVGFLNRCDRRKGSAAADDFFWDWRSRRRRGRGRSGRSMPDCVI